MCIRDRGYVEELYQEALTDTAELDPRFRRHPHVGVDTAGIWVWRTDDRIDMREHLQRRTLPAGGDREVLWKLISELHSEPLDRSRPMWMAYVIDGLAGGRFAFYIKVHHTMVDGVAGLRIITDGLITDPESRSMRPIYAVGPKQPPPVSYTHLDVYKRQVEAISCGNVASRGGQSWRVDGAGMVIRRRLTRTPRSASWRPRSS